MKKIYLLLASMVILLTSCEEVVDVDLNTAEPRLVIDAALKWEKGTPGNIQVIRLSTTTDYFSDEIPWVTGADITVTDSQNNIFTFNEIGPGEYVCENFAPSLLENYILTVVVNGQTYTASETLFPVPSIDYTSQSTDGGFTGDNPEIKAFFTDNAATDDYYQFSYFSPVEPYPVYEVYEDRLIQGNQMFGAYSNEDLNSGDVVTIYISGISERYYNYMRILLSISGGGGGSPFQSPPATVRGNIVNNTDADNYALGFFSVSESDVRSVEIE